MSEKAEVAPSSLLGKVRMCGRRVNMCGGGVNRRSGWCGDFVMGSVCDDFSDVLLCGSLCLCICGGVQRMAVTVTDGRMFVGLFSCIDRQVVVDCSFDCACLMSAFSEIFYWPRRTSTPALGARMK